VYFPATITVDCPAIGRPYRCVSVDCVRRGDCLSVRSVRVPSNVTAPVCVRPSSRDTTSGRSRAPTVRGRRKP